MCAAAKMEEMQQQELRGGGSACLQRILCKVSLPKPAVTIANKVPRGKDEDDFEKRGTKCLKP